MPVFQPTWTVERVELLKTRFEAGLSCREIAAHIGVSRNAVIGKLSRLNLTREKSADERRPARKSAASAREASRERPGISPENDAAAAISDAAGRLRRAAAVSRRRADQRRTPLLVARTDEARCRWPINTPGAEDFCFCGNPPVEGLPYCAGHTRLAYRPTSRAARG